MPRPPNKNVRQKILSAAADIFFTDGFQKVTISDLVTTLRTSKSTIYKYFRSKEAVVEALMDEFNEQVDDKLHCIVMDKSADFRKKLEEVTAYTCQVLTRVQRPFFNDLRIHTPQLWRRYEKARERRLDKYYRFLFAEGVQQQLIRDDIHIDFVLMLYTKMTEVLIDTNALNNFPFTTQQAYEMITCLFLEGALTKNGKQMLSK
ncbi:MAG: TetR/AcrR family transcriptional regulator [Desulfobacteraceae bacterium]|jgi:AcrR family transcriptional regulator